MEHIIAVGLGGFVGAILRYLFCEFAKRNFSSSPIPYGTLGVNVVGCLVLGFLGKVTQDNSYLSPRMKSFIMVGILGSFTTFSTFGLETFLLMENKQMFMGILNILLHVLIGLVAVYAGYLLGKIV